MIAKSVFGDVTLEIDDIPPEVSQLTIDQLEAIIRAKKQKAKDEQFADLDKLIEKTNKLLGSSGYTIKDLYFRERSKDGSAATKKAGTYKVGDKEIKWSGLGKRPVELKGKSNEELAKLRKE
jgi:DNA-binding protein H-NS